MTTKNYSCWSCKFFKQEGSLPTSNHGRCRRHAPLGLDYFGLVAAMDQRRHDAASVKSDLLVGSAPLYRSGQDSIGLPIVPASGGFNADSCYPWVFIPGDEVEQIEIQLARANVGTATVGDVPKLKLELVAIYADSQSVIRTIDLDIDRTKVGVSGATEDYEIKLSYHLGGESFQMPTVSFGFRLKLDETDNNVIAEVRNPNVCVITKRYDNIAPSSTKFAHIEPATTSWCGEYVRSDKPVPDPPEIAE